MAQWVENPTAATWVAAEVLFRSPAQCSCGIGCRIRYLAWELTYAAGVAMGEKKILRIESVTESLHFSYLLVIAVAQR